MANETVTSEILGWRGEPASWVKRRLLGGSGGAQLPRPSPRTPLPTPYLEELGVGVGGGGKGLWPLAPFPNKNFSEQVHGKPFPDKNDAKI